MCGICGVIKKKKITDEDSELVRKMSKVIAHRGPDDEGFFDTEHISIGHRRLSIIDISSAGHQPMKYLGRYTITFNGEIYNYVELRKDLIKEGYKFVTNTDTEVIMASYDFWGVECFNKFNGMWALVIYDATDNKVVLSRDRFGVKPLYYYKREDYIVFASEIKAILQDKTIERKANDNIVYDYLSQGLIDHTKETFFRGIYQFPRASYVSTDFVAFDFTPVTYWNLDFNGEIEDNATKEECASFKRLFENSVKLRLRSDVPVGSCLSGGLDSSAIVCTIDNLKEDAQKQHTFSYRADVKKLDEYKYMEVVINETNVEASFVSPESNDLMSEIDDLIYHQDEPFSTTGMFAGYCVYREAKNKGVTVLLDGQGADELLCGYRKSRIYYIKKLLKDHKYANALRELCLSMSQVKSSLIFDSNRKSDIKKILRIVGINKSGNNFGEQYYNQDFLRKTTGYGYDRNKDFQYNDVFHISLPSLLRYTDRNSMAFSVESRLPFLDYRFAEYCARLSISKKIEKGYSKAIMRKSLRLPDKIKYRKDKLGFVTPEDEWIKKTNEEIKKVFLNDNFRADRYLDRKNIVRDWDKIIYEGKIPYFFRMYCLEKWMQIFEVE